MDFLSGRMLGRRCIRISAAFFRQAQRKPLPQGLRAAWNQTVEKTQRLESDKDPYWKYGATPYCGPIIGYRRVNGNEIKLRLWVEPILSCYHALGTSSRASPRHPDDRCPLPANPVIPERTGIIRERSQAILDSIGSTMFQFHGISARTFGFRLITPTGQTLGSKWRKCRRRSVRHGGGEGRLRGLARRGEGNEDSAQRST